MLAAILADPGCNNCSEKGSTKERSECDTIKYLAGTAGDVLATAIHGALPDHRERTPGGHASPPEVCHPGRRAAVQGGGGLHLGDGVQGDERHLVTPLLDYVNKNCTSAGAYTTFELYLVRSVGSWSRFCNVQGAHQRALAESVPGSQRVDVWC
jgi:hypothetical protein